MKQGVFARLEVVVLKRHVMDGVCSEHDECAIALAVKEALPNATNVSVGSTISFDLNGGSLSFAPTKKVSKFIRDFDKVDDKPGARRKLKPLGKFTVEARF